MINTILTAFCALTIGTSVPEVKDTAVFYMIDGKVVKSFDGSQLNGKTIDSYRIGMTKTMSGEVTKVHFIKTTDNPQKKEQVQYFVNDQPVSEDDFKRIDSADVKQMLVSKAGSNEAIKLTGSALTGAVQIYLKNQSAAVTSQGLDDVVVTVYGRPKEKVDLYTTSEEAVPFSTVDVKPKFNGEDAARFSQWVTGRLLYPQSAKQAGVQGMVTVTFKVNSDGKVSDVRVLRGVCDALDAEAVRVVSSSPDWTPGEYKGKKVAVTYTFPVLFRMK